MLSNAIASALKVEGWFWKSQMRHIAKWVMLLPQGRLLVEIGTYHGRSALFFALCNPRILVLTIDNLQGWKQQPILPIGEAVLRQGNIFQVIGESPEIASHFNWPVDFLFVNGDHRKQHVKADLASWSLHLRAGSYIAVHDYDDGHWEVRDAADEWLAEHPEFKVLSTAERMLIARRQSWETIL